MNLAIKRIITMSDSYTRTNKVGPVRVKNRRRKVRTPLGEFASVLEAAEAHGTYPQRIWNWVHAKKPGFGYFD